MLKKVLTALAMALMSGVMVTAVASFPIVRNFTRASYGGGSQNWSIAQAADGSMLFANSNGLLVYDSRNWELMPTDNGTALRSVYIDNRNDRVYVGVSNDFGYFAPEAASRALHYTSLRNTINTTDIEFSEIWHIFQNGSFVWFQGDFKMFCYDGSKTSCINTGRKITTSALIGGQIYVAFIDGTIGTVNGPSIGALPGLDELRGTRICSLLPLPDGRVLVVTAFHGLYAYDGRSLSRYVTDIDPFLRENQIFCATINELSLVFGTVNNGAVIRDLTTGANTFINKEAGLQNNTVLTASFDSFSNLWLGLDNGIDYVLANSPITSLLGDISEYGAGYASMLYGGRLWLGTNQGLYSIPATQSSAGHQEVRPELKGQIWSIDTIAGTMLVSGDAGLFSRNGDTFEYLPGIPGSWAVIPLKHMPGYAVASTYDNLYLLHREGGRWVSAGKISGYSDVGGRPVEDAEGNLWIAHWLKGVYRLRPSHEYRSIGHIDLFNTANGLLSDRNNVVMSIDGELLFSGSGTLYRLDAATDSLVSDELLNKVFHDRSTSKVFRAPGGELWSVSPTNITVATMGAGGALHTDSTTFRPLTSKLIPGFENFDFVSDHRLIVSSQDGFYDIDITQRSDTAANHPVYITRVLANRDSLIYNDVVFRSSESTIPKISYDLNSLYFEFVAPEYRAPDAVTYTYLLENYDSEWSPASTASSKEYTRLSEGSYTFRVRAFNTYTGVTSECALQFSIAPPWYRSLAAKIVYLLLILGAIYGGLRLFQRYSQRAAHAMEARKEEELEAMKREAREEALQKDYEIARLKSEQLETDIKNKSGELSSITMNVIRKNEILLDIASRLTKIQESVRSTHDDKAVDKQLDKIKLLIRENISHDDDWRSFTRNFDIVYENYMKRLVDKYPSLSATDQRLCAYLKMGLSSKEIAPLLNISYRSVEMTRYRLRKKMGLGRDVNLAEYLRNF